MGDLKDCANSGVPSLVLRPCNYGSKLAWNWSKTMKTRLGVHIFRPSLIDIEKSLSPGYIKPVPCFLDPPSSKLRAEMKAGICTKRHKEPLCLTQARKMFKRNFKKRRYFCPTRYSDPEDSDASSSPSFFFNSQTIPLSPHSIA